MSLLSITEPDQAEGRLAEIYGECQAGIGFVPNAFRSLSPSPELLDQQWRHVRYTMQHPRLSAYLFTLIRLLVSERETCDYCINLNTAILINECGLDPAQVTALRADPDSAPLKPAEKAMLRFVLAATADPHAVSSDDVQALRDLGYTDGDILDALNHGARQVGLDILINAFKVKNDF